MLTAWDEMITTFVAKMEFVVHYVNYTWRSITINAHIYQIILNIFLCCHDYKMLYLIKYNL